MNADLIAMMQLIARNAARGRGLKYGLKLLEIEEKAFRNSNGHANGKGHNGDRAPMPAQFIRAPEHPVTEEPPAAETEPGVVKANGQEYVE